MKDFSLKYKEKWFLRKRGLNMDKEIYDFLRNYGLLDAEIDYIEDNNINIFYINIGYAIKIISFLESKGLTQEEVKRTLLDNPYMITVGEQRLELWNEIYDRELQLTNEELKNLLLVNSQIYTASPIEFKKILEYMKEDHVIEDVKRFILSNPDIIIAKFDILKRDGKLPYVK